MSALRARSLTLAMTDGNEDTQLDPALWERLPEELLEKVIAKLGFSRAVAFRTVCKHWHSQVILNAVAYLEASSKSALLYFASSDEYKGYPQCLQVCKAESEDSRVHLEELCQSSFPAPRFGEDICLLICEQGLLFFGFFHWGDETMRDVVVCNPLISQCKSLSLPCPLGPIVFGDHDESHTNLLTGVIFDSTTRSYCFVCAGVEGTYVYDSITSAWTSGVSVLPQLKEVAHISSAYFSSSRSVCCGGNLYWYTRFVLRHSRDTFSCVLKLDIQLTTWTIIPDVFVACPVAVSDSDFIASHKGNVLLWHLHNKPLADGEQSLEILSHDDFDWMDVDKADDLRPQYDWPCRAGHNLELTPEIKLMRMPHYMMGKVYQFVIENVKNAYDCDYYAFSQENFIYHLVGKDSGVCILVHDTDEDVYTKLFWVDLRRFCPPRRFPCFPPPRRCFPRNVWSFSPSLTLLP